MRSELKKGTMDKYLEGIIEEIKEHKNPKKETIKNLDVLKKNREKANLMSKQDLIDFYVNTLNEEESNK